MGLRIWIARSSSAVIRLLDSTALIIRGITSGDTPTAVARAWCKSSTNSAASSSTGFVSGSEVSLSTPPFPSPAASLVSI
ncbi:hypothetical protein D9M68_924240 [compost metagenome]